MLALRRWGIPLCINDHWVLGFIDFMLREIGIYDSKPNLGTHYYASKVSPCKLIHITSHTDEYTGSSCYY